jgi:hypothetical protein
MLEKILEFLKIKLGFSNENLKEILIAKGNNDTSLIQYILNHYSKDQNRREVLEKLFEFLKTNLGFDTEISREALIGKA